MSSSQQMKKHFLKCHGIKDTHEKMDLQGSKSSKSHGSGESSSKPKKDKGDKCSKQEKGDKPCGSESKSGSKTTSQEQVLESLHHSQCIAGSSPEGGHHKSHKKLKKHGKNCINPIRSHINRHRSVRFQARFLTVLLFSCF